ncbi:MAG: Spy/CpxP family protein refolding chaperone [bacterium]
MRKLFAICLVLSVALLVMSGISPAQLKKEIMKASPGWLTVGSPGYINFLLKFAGELGLSADQTSKLKSISAAFEKEAAKINADIRVAEIELREALDKKDVNLSDVESIIKKSESLRSQLRLSMIKSQVEARSLLTDEQFEKLKSLALKRPQGPKR